MTSILGDGDAHSNHILTKTGRIDGPLNKLPVNTHGRVEIDLAAALKGHAREPGGVGEDESNDEAGGSPMRSTSRRSQLPQRGRSLKRVSGRKGSGVVPTSNHDKCRLLAKMKLKDLTKQEKELKGELQNIMRRIFKDLTGIRVMRKKFADPIPLPDPLEPGADPWLDESGMELMTPNFTEDVNHQTNSAILGKTADLTVHEINDNPPDIVLNLYSSVPFKHRQIASRKRWNKLTEKIPITGADLQKMGWQLATVPQFVANYGFNPTAVLHVDWMSDEDSEPEGINKHETAHERQEAMTAWRTSCLYRLGITGDIKLHDDLALLEVASGLLHELSRIHYLSLSSAERQSSKYKCIKKLGRSTREPALTAPYPFMINEPWWFEMKEGEHGEYVQSWSSFDNPPNFDDFKEINILQVLKQVGDGADDGEEDHESGHVED
ncbi:hypothetical protein JB92DRAFT_3132525 [Gautieria morchelliformis]|nr:hypothetical protein JB92DRAFT_3132525 [Gautieria morchelliformis]